MFGLFGLIATLLIGVISVEPGTLPLLLLLLLPPPPPSAAAPRAMPAMPAAPIPLLAATVLVVDAAPNTAPADTRAIEM